MVQPSETSAKGKPKKRKSGQPIACFGTREANEAMRLQICAAAWGWKVKAKNLRQIGEAVCQQFGIAPVAESTVMRWLDDYRSICTRKIGQAREEYIGVTIPRIEAKLERFLEVALGGNFVTERTVQIGGEEFKVIDENTFKERLAAAHFCLKAEEQQRKILGVGLANGPEETDGKQATLTQINVLLQQTINNHGAQAGKQVGNTPLTLEAGDAEFEAL